MSDLTVIKHENGLMVDSRDVSDMVEKNHAHLLRDIKGYVDIIDPNPNLDSANFFIPSTRVNSIAWGRRTSLAEVIQIAEITFRMLQRCRVT